MKDLKGFGSTDGVSIPSKPLKGSTGDICCHYVKSPKKGTLNRRSGKAPTGKMSTEKY